MSNIFELLYLGNLLSCYKSFGLNIFYSSQDVIKDQAERKAMFSPLLAFAYIFYCQYAKSTFTVLIALAFVCQLPCCPLY